MARRAFVRIQLPLRPKAHAFRELGIFSQQESDDFSELSEVSGGAQAHSFQGQARGAGFEEEVEAHFAQEQEVDGRAAAEAALLVFAGDDVEPPMEVVFHLPVPAHAAGNQRSIGREAADQESPPKGDFAVTRLRFSRSHRARLVRPLHWLRQARLSKGKANYLVICIGNLHWKAKMAGPRCGPAKFSELSNGEGD